MDKTSDPDELVKIQTMLNSIFKQYPGAGKCEHALEKIAEELGQ